MRPLNHKSRMLACVALALAMAAVYPAGAVLAGTSTAAFDTADAAVAALIGAARSDDPQQAIVEVLGDSGVEILDSGDPVADSARRARFVAAFEAAHKVESDGSGKSTLLIGADEYPFPIPLVETEGKWRWDTAAGLDAILTRRIGENELSTIEVMRAFADAQREYAASDRDGEGPQYARRLKSREGRKDGLFWPAVEGEEPSPIGPLVAKAQLEGYSARGDGTSSYHGYIYRMLYGQGRHATGGARDYIVNDRMIGGFALIAIPAEYANSGVMTFIISQDGDVYEQDLGPNTRKIGAGIKLFDPDASWRKVEP